MPRMRRDRGRSPATSRTSQSDDLLAHIRRCLLYALNTERELTHAELLRRVTSRLPRARAAALLRGLRRADLLARGLRPAWDVLDGAGCPVALRGEMRELARLALFGPAGQGRQSDSRHREALRQTLCAEIMRECRDESGLRMAAARALHHPGVIADPELESAIRAFVSERESELASRMAQQRHEAEQMPTDWFTRPARPAPPAPAQSDAAPAAGESTPPRDHSPSATQVLTAFERMRRDFNDSLVHFDIARCRQILTQAEALHARYPALIPGAGLERFTEELQRLETRRHLLLSEISKLEEAAFAAAREGSTEQVSRALQRLSSLHAARPELFPDEHFARIRARIETASHEHEHRQAARELLARERAVAAEIKHLADGIRAFHALVRDLPHDDPRYLTAEREYQALVRALRSHDREWLAGLILELDGLLDVLHDTTHRAEVQVDRFLASVRAALNELQREIGDISRETAADH